MSTKKSGSSDLRRRLSLLLTIGLLGSACSTAGPTSDSGGSSGDPASSVVRSPDGATGNGESGDGATGNGENGDGPAPSETTGGHRAVFEVEPARWRGCGDGLECTTVTVPRDHDDPAGPTIDLALVRVPATDPGPATGSILVNPGGPGGSGVDFIRAGFRLDDATMASHHLVGFDPRGIGASAPLACGDEAQPDPKPDLAPDDRAERNELDRVAQRLAGRCDELDGDLLPHLSTSSVVADLDLIRRAMGDPGLSYIGFSYGTFIGLHYAERFPQRVRRMVLDGVVDPARPLASLLAQQAEGFDRLLGSVDQACDRSFDCPDGGIIATYDRLAARLDAEGPIDGVGSTELAIGTLISLYSESLWPRLARALDEADRGHYERIGALEDIYESTADVAAYHAVVCTDGPVPNGTAGWDRLEAQLAARSPRFGPILANEVRACAHWPVRSTEAPEEVAPAEVAPILVLSTTGDAATPVENAVAVAAALPGAGLVTLEGDSHTAYGRSFCVDGIVADYLATGQVPTSIHRC